MKMVTMMNSTAAAFLVVVVVVMNSASMAAASPADVNIYNEIRGATIQVNCGSFGERPLLYGQQFGWGFKPSIWGYTKWTCGFRWGDKAREFMVWVDDGLFWGTVPVRPCKHCVWHVRTNGFYRNGKFGTPVFVYGWTHAKATKLHD